MGLIEVDKKNIDNLIKWINKEINF